MLDRKTRLSSARNHNTLPNIVHNIVLVGFMGTGKSEVGRRLAARLGRVFIDTDTVIEQKMGISIAQLFAEKGENYFRQQERHVIAQTCQSNGQIIATGGGAIVDPLNAQQLKENGFVVCLSAVPEVIYERVRCHADRPLLQGEDPLTKIRTLLQARAEAYAQADVTIDTSQRSADEVTDAVLTVYNRTLHDSA